MDKNEVIETYKLISPNNINKTCLVAKNMSPKKEEWEKLGFIFIDIPGDDVLLRAILPDGWSVKDVNHPLLSKIVDENGYERARMYYKSNSNARSAYMDLLCFYDVRFKYDDYGNEIVYFGTEKKILYQVGEIMNAKTNDEMIENLKLKESLIDKAKLFGDRNYIDWRNPLAYWNQLSYNNIKTKK